MSTIQFDQSQVYQQYHDYMLDLAIQEYNHQLLTMSRDRKVSGMIRDGVFTEIVDPEFQRRHKEVLDKLHQYRIDKYPLLFPIEMTLERRGLKMRRKADNLLEAVIYGPSEKAQEVLDAFNQHRGYTLLELTYQSDESRYYIKFEYNP